MGCVHHVHAGMPTIIKVEFQELKNKQQNKMYNIDKVIFTKQQIYPHL